MHISSNTFYRITNVALGTSFSLDVASPDKGAPTGLVDVTPTALFAGQVWQLLSFSQPGKGPFYVSSSMLGAQKKLDISMGEEEDTWIPYLKNLTMSHDQTWILSASNDTVPGSNATTYSFSPSMFRGSKALSVDGDSLKTSLEDVGGANQQWMLTPVMKINDASYSASALMVMATQTGSPKATASATETPTSSNFQFDRNRDGSRFSIPKTTLIAIVLAPITLVLALVMLISFFMVMRRRCKRKKAAARIDEKLENQSREDSTPQVYFGSRPQFATAPSRIYAPSIASSGDYGRSTTQPDFSPLEPRPRSRPTSWVRERDNIPFYGGSTLGDKREREGRSLISPLPPVELPAHSRRQDYMDVQETSPITPSSPRRQNDTWYDTPSTSSPPAASRTASIKRQVSLISRWKL